LETGDGHQSTQDSILTRGDSRHLSNTVTAAQVPSSSDDEDNSVILNHEELLRKINREAEEISFLLDNFIENLRSLIGLEAMSSKEIREDIEAFDF
jgi:hypothetical protein